MAKTININGVDFTSYFTPSGFVCAYTKIDGGNGGTMKNGDTIQDIVAVKARGQATCMPLTEEQQKTLLSTIYSSQPVLLQYFDARTGADRTVEAYMETNETVYRGIGATGNTYWTGLVGSFSEV